MMKAFVCRSGLVNPHLLKALIFLGVAIPFLSAVSASPDAAKQNLSPAGSTAYPVGRVEHVSGREEDVQISPAYRPPLPVQVIPREVSRPSIPVVSTGSTFLAHWAGVNGATGYRLDVSEQSSFSSYVNGYQNLDVGNVTSRVVTGLSPHTKYYYRVRAYNAGGTSGDSQPMVGTTAQGAGLVINAAFDSTITGNMSSIAIQSMIMQAVSIFENLFSDPITVSILFRYSTTRPDGTPASGLATSNSVFYTFPWNTYIGALQADATSSNDTAANASLPATALSTNLNPSSANGRAIGLNTPPAMDANGNVGSGPGFIYDGIVILNSSNPFQFTRPVSAGNYDAQRSTEHEIDEVLGFGSYLIGGGSDLRPQDLFSWSSPGTRNIMSSGTRYFSIDNGNTDIVDFNQGPTGDFGDWDSSSCPQLNPYVQNAFVCVGQSSDVTQSSPEGINLDVIGYNLAPAGTPTPTPSATPTPTPIGSPSLLNISTRMRVLTGDNVLIGGFIITGTDDKRVIVRAIGPSLTSQGVPGALQDPTLELHDSTGALIAFNDDWRDTQESEIQATGIPPSNDLESAIVATLAANNAGYTAIVRGFNNETGIGLVEAYDLDQSANSKLANISTRGFVDTGNNVMIGGFILGNGVTDVLLRAIGPSLTAAGVANALQDPTLELHDGNGAVIAFDDDWRDTQQAQIQATGIPPSNDLESAIFATLAPGNYTAIVAGFNGMTGVGLVEVYQLNH